MAQIKNPTPPVSKTAQRLLAQIHAEAEAATLAALSAKDGIVTLQDVDRDSTSFYQYRDGDMDFRDRHGYRLELRRLRCMPECWRDQPHMQGAWRPGQWDVEEVRVDGAGRKWRTDLGPHITDDFGALVPVGTEGGAA